MGNSMPSHALNAFSRRATGAQSPQENCPLAGNGPMSSHAFPVAVRISARNIQTDSSGTAGTIGCFGNIVRTIKMA